MNFFDQFGRASARFMRPLRAVQFRYALLATTPVLFFASAHVAVAQQTASRLTLEDAFERALAFDPGLRAADAGVAAARGGLTQARTRPNPTLGAETENFSGSGPLKGFNGAETTFSLSQELELGGKRRARITVAERELNGAALDRVLRGLDLLRDVQLAYYEALAADETLGISRERLTTAQALASDVSRRVNAARDPVMADARAKASVAAARIDVERAEGEATNARAKLAAYWGGETTFNLDAVDFEVQPIEAHPHDTPDDKNPALARIIAERDRAKATVTLEKSAAYQNPTLSFGYRRFEETNGDGAFVAGVSIPLGVFDRNQGSIAKAKAEEMRAAYDLDAARLSLMRDFASLQRALSTDATAIQSLETKVIPQTERALALARDGYARGAFSYLDVLEAQRALSESRSARIDALRSYHQNEAALDRLTARFAEAAGKEIHQ